MKKLLMVAMTLFVAATTVNAEFTIVKNGIRYILDSGQAIVTYPEDGNIYGYYGNIVVPNDIEYDGETYVVRKIGALAFKGQEKLVSVTIPSSVYDIGDYSFAFCENLESITIQAEYLYINYDAFLGSMESIKAIFCPKIIVLNFAENGTGSWFRTKIITK